MQTRLNILNNGQEVQISDLNSMSQVASAADDQVFTELFRLEPFGLLGGGATAKAVMPYGVRNQALAPVVVGATASTVVSGGLVSSTGTVAVFPHRALIGTRTSPGGTANTPNWASDTRSNFYVGTFATANYTTQALAANASGNPRWDLVYTAVAVDSPTSNVTRFVKNPTTKVVSTQSLSVTLATTTTVGVVTGTAGATPVRPSAPADAAGTFYVPLAYVYVPNGFTSASTVGTSQIRDVSPVAPISRTTGAVSIRMANGNNDGAGTYAGGALDGTSTYAWNGTNGGAGNRKGVWLPPSMMGGEELIAEIDFGAPSHAKGSIVDSSTDWRNRFFHVTANFGVSAMTFVNDPAQTIVALPASAAAAAAESTPETAVSEVALGQSFWADNLIASTGSTVYFGNNAASSLGSFATGLTFLLYVSQTDGTLRVSWTGSPTSRAFFWIRASAPFPDK